MISHQGKYPNNLIEAIISSDIKISTTLYWLPQNMYHIPSFFCDPVACVSSLARL